MLDTIDSGLPRGGKRLYRGLKRDSPPPLPPALRSASVLELHSCGGRTAVTCFLWPFGI